MAVKKFLQTNLNFEKWLEEEKQAKNEIETIRRKRSEWKKCCCKDARREERFDETLFCFYHRIFKYAHWLREKLTSAEVQKEELKSLIENVQAILKVVETTYQHEKAEWELDNSKEAGQNEDYEIINKGIIELEQETTE
ncbi:9078_t:CDS:2 [Entrophospora sp. SA101]|nr:9078_t:CDS:2 [Entrophospora sp. SA101]